MTNLPPKNLVALEKLPIKESIRIWQFNVFTDTWNESKANIYKKKIAKLGYNKDYFDNCTNVITPGTNVLSQDEVLWMITLLSKSDYLIKKNKVILYYKSA